MTRKILHIACTLVFLFQTLFTFSQQVPNVKASVDRNQILIGEPIQLTLEANLSLGTNISWPALDTIPHFAIVEKDKIDSVDGADGKLYHQRLVITSFDSGTQVIPAFHFTMESKKYVTDSISIEVSFSKFDPRQDYHDIRDIIDIENPDVKYVIWIVLAATLVSIALFTYLAQKKKLVIDTLEEQPVQKLSAYDEAIKSLEELKKQRLPDTGQTKLFYTRLNDILRLFVLRKLQIASLEKTNEELIMQLNALNISREQFSQLAAALRMSDFVKFAKYLPGQSDNENNFKIIESSIHLLNEIEK